MKQIMGWLSDFGSALDDVALRRRSLRRARTITATALLLLLISVARADGKLFQQAIVPTPPETPDQRALVVYDEATGIETLVVETTARVADDGLSSELAWVIALPSVPTIDVSTTGLFPTLETFCAPAIEMGPSPEWLLILGLGIGVWCALRWWRQPLRIGCALALPWVGACVGLVVAFALFPPSCSSQPLGVDDGSGVRVLQRSTVGVFDTTTLTADDAHALQRWLTENGFAAPETLEPVVADLLRDGWVFVASRVRPVGVSGVQRLHPLAFTFTTDDAVYPMRLTGVDGAPLRLELFVAGASRAEAEGLDVVHCENLADAPAREFHDEYSERVGRSAVLTKLSGELRPAEMLRDVAIGWSPFQSLRTTWYSPLAAFHRGADSGVLAAVRALVLAGILGRRLAAQSSRRITAFDPISLAIALAAGLWVTLVAASALPRIPVNADAVFPEVMDSALSGRLARPPAAVMGDAVAVRAWASAVTSGVHNPYSGSDVREEDSPGNWWLRTTGDRIEIVLWEGMHPGETIDVSGSGASEDR